MDCLDKAAELEVQVCCSQAHWLRLERVPLSCCSFGVMPRREQRPGHVVLGFCQPWTRHRRTRIQAHDTFCTPSSLRCTGPSEIPRQYCAIRFSNRADLWLKLALAAWQLLHAARRRAGCLGGSISRVRGVVSAVLLADRHQL